MAGHPTSAYVLPTCQQDEEFGSQSKLKVVVSKALKFFGTLDHDQTREEN